MTTDRAKNIQEMGVSDVRRELLDTLNRLDKAEAELKQIKSDTVPRSRYDVTCDQYNNSELIRKEQMLTAKKTFIALERKIKDLENSVTTLRDEQTKLIDETEYRLRRERETEKRAEQAEFSLLKKHWSCCSDGLCDMGCPGWPDAKALALQYCKSEIDKA